MPRIPYLPEDHAEPADLVEAIRARRGGKLLKLDRMLLHSPPYARGWNALLGAVRRELSLPARLREMAICAVARENRDEFEWRQHQPEFLAEGGSAAQAAALADPAAAAGNAALFDPAERAVLTAAIQMTRGVRMDEAAFAALRSALADDRQVVELVAVVASFNMVSRFIEALGVEPEDSA